MKPRWRTARPAHVQVIGIIACTGAAGPIFLLMYTLALMLRGLDDAELWSTPLSSLVLGCAIASLISLPTIIMIAIGAYVLARMKRDTFIMSVVCGAAIAFVGISITSEITVGGSPLTEPDNIKDVVLLVLGSSIMSALYWLVAGRRIRNRRELTEQALRAME